MHPHDVSIIGTGAAHPWRQDDCCLCPGAPCKSKQHPQHIGHLLSPPYPIHKHIDIALLQGSLAGAAKRPAPLAHSRRMNGGPYASLTQRLPLSNGQARQDQHLGPRIASTRLHTRGAPRSDCALAEVRSARLQVIALLGGDLYRVFGLHAHSIHITLMSTQASGKASGQICHGTVASAE